MTRQRAHGNDSCFGDWIRCQEDIDSVINGVTLNDIDMMVHQYRTNLDALGLRPVHLMLQVEVKVLGGVPNPYQRQTLFFQHQRLNGKEFLVDAKKQDGSKISVWHFGVYVLSCPGFYPGDNSDYVTWYRWSHTGSLVPTEVTVEKLKSILRFDLRPDDLSELSIRRHHKTTELIVSELTPLGLCVDSLVTRRS